MEHIVQIGIGIDDDSIIKNVSAHAETAITNQLLMDIKKVIFGRTWGGNIDEDRLSFFVNEKLDLFISENKNAIIDSAGKYLAEKLCRTKKAKELLDTLSGTEVSSE